VACIIFTAGCNFRCGFCHNPQFVDPQQIQKLAPNCIPEKKFFHFLDCRKKFLDGVVISGGEPTIHSDLEDFIQNIKTRGLQVKLDTNGTNPEMVEKLLEKNLVDYIAMDIKSVPQKQTYEKICEISVDLEKIIRTKNHIQNANIAYEFRTTVLQEFHSEKSIEHIAQFCQNAPKYTIQNFRPEKTLSQKFQNFSGFQPAILDRFKQIAQKYIAQVEVQY
jgi:pyruvate formate lyase activating enzyme